MAIRTSELLTIGALYSRKRLRELFSIADATINTGIFRPAGHDSVWLFVTEQKTADRTQYVDRLDGDDLHFEGQTAGRTDDLIARHRELGVELLLFHRARKDEHANYAFRYEGTFEFVSSKPGPPTRFHLRRLEASQWQAIAQLAGYDAEPSNGQGHTANAAERRAIERHAQRIAEEHFISMGYEVSDVSATRPYDLHCVRGSEERHIEVKGTVGNGATVFLTRNEVDHARRHPDQAALFIVRQIILDRTDLEPVCRGGIASLVMPWCVDDGTLTALQFEYRPPLGATAVP